MENKSKRRAVHLLIFSIHKAKKLIFNISMIKLNYQAVTEYNCSNYKMCISH